MGNDIYKKANDPTPFKGLYSKAKPMPDEQSRATITTLRGQQAAKMPHEEAKKYVAGSANVDKDYEGTAAETDRTSNQQQKQAVLGSMKKGGMISKTGVYHLHKGEKVIPAHMVAHGPNKNMIHAKSSANHKRYDFGKE